MIVISGGMHMERNNRLVPVWEQFNLTIEEAAQYFRIGEKRLRQIVSEHPDAPFVLRIGNRVLIKRRLFEDYLEGAMAV